jgi:hypothetical protein
MIDFILDLDSSILIVMIISIVLLLLISFLIFIITHNKIACYLFDKSALIDYNESFYSGLSKNNNKKEKVYYHYRCNKCGNDFYATSKTSIHRIYK